MFKRITLFILTNIAVMITVNFLLRLFNVQPYLQAYGLNYESLAVFCLIWGFAGAFISLLMSKWTAKMFMRVQVIDPQTTDPNLAFLVKTVHRLAQSAGISKMPEVGIYDSPDVNAFATGPTKNNSLVAVSTGLLQRMDSASIEGVLGHEIAHIANGDMVTMTLIQGIVNAFVMFLSRVLAFAIMQFLRRDNERSSGFSHGIYFLVSMLLEFFLMFLGMLIVAWFSRHREFRADAGGANYAGRGKMIAALKKLQAAYKIPEDKVHPAVATLQISSRSGFLKLFSTHPPLEERIARLEAAGSYL